jgi:hypothetical protein
MRTHADGFEVSMNSFAVDYEWGRARVAEAFAELVDAGWLAIRRYVNGKGNRVYDEYHFDVSRRFTPEEIAEYGSTIMLPPARGASPESTYVQHVGSGGCIEAGQGDASREDTKEHHQQHNSEHHALEQPQDDIAVVRSGRCYQCEQFGWRECRQHAEPYNTTRWSTLVSTAPFAQGSELGW